MWTLNCGCSTPIPEKIIYDIPETQLFYSKIILPDIDKDCKIKFLKEKIIKEYLDILNKLECGV